MAERQPQQQTVQQQPQQQQEQQPQEQQQVSHPVVKASAAAAAGGSMLVLSGLTLAATVIALAVETPLLVIFSPVLVPASIAVFLIAGGFLASGGLGVAALSVLVWMYKYLTGKQPPGSEQIDQARMRYAAKAREGKDSTAQRIEQASA